MKIVICVGCWKQVLQRLKNKAVNNFGKHTNLDIRVTDAETLHIVEEEAGFCQFEVERLLNRCLRTKGADCNVVSGCFITAKKFGVVDGVDYRLSGETISALKLTSQIKSRIPSPLTVPSQTNVALWISNNVTNRPNT